MSCVWAGPAATSTARVTTPPDRGSAALSAYVPVGTSRKLYPPVAAAETDREKAAAVRVNEPLVASPAAVRSVPWMAPSAGYTTFRVTVSLGLTTTPSTVTERLPRGWSALREKVPGGTVTKRKLPSAAGFRSAVRLPWVRRNVPPDTGLPSFRRTWP